MSGAEESAEEAELLAAFDRLRPQGSVTWAFDDAVRRVDQPDLDSAAGALPWRGLPDDLWDRGRSARIGRRFVGDVAGVLADILAADARNAADAAVGAVNGDRFVAAWSAFHYLAARVEALEARVDPLGLQAAEWPMAAPDLSEWMDEIPAWIGGADPDDRVVVGESGDGAVVGALCGRGLSVEGVEPRGAAFWKEATADEGTGAVVVLDEVAHHLGSLPDRQLAGVVLSGCVDRLPVADLVALLGQAIRVVRPEGTVILFTTDQAAWDAALSNPARDLARGRPLHPETWTLLMERSGMAAPVWHRPRSGVVHALVAGVDR